MSSFILSAIESCFSVSTWAKNRFDLRNIIEISSYFIKAFAIVALFMATPPTIGQVGFGIFISTVFTLVGYFILWKRLTPDLVIAPRLFDRFRIQQLFSMGGWMVVNQIGSLLFLNIDLIVANMVLGAKMAGEYGSILIFSSLLRTLAGTVSNVLGPTIVAKFVHHHFDDMTRLSAQSVRLLGIAIGLPVGLLCGLGKPFLQLWLGRDFGNLWVLLCLMVFHLPINLAVLPIFGIQTASNKVKVPGIVTLVMGIINLFTALLFTTVFKWGPYGIAAAAAIVLTIKNAAFTPLYAAYFQKIAWYTYIKSLIPGLLTALLIGLVSFSATNFLLIDSWGGLILVGVINSIIYLGLVFIVGLKKEDKSLILRFVPSIVKL